jgi:salicylate hydroxylase
VILLANGIRGAGREVVTGKDARNSVAFANTVCYRALAPAEPAKKAGLNPAILTRPSCFMGTGQVCSLCVLRLKC